MNCNVCRNQNAKFFMRKNEHDMYKCSGCGLMYVSPIPDSSAVYNEDYFSGASKGFGYADYDADKKPMLSAWGKYLDIIEEIIPNKGKLLDVGAATGYFLKVAHERGWSVKGVELSDYAAKSGRDNGLDIVTGTLEDISDQDTKFDAITMWDLVEHLPDPKKTLNQASHLLKQGGVVAINTPDVGSVPAKILGKKWHLIVPPEHLHYFNENSLALLLQKAGFEVLMSGRFGKTFTLYYIIRFIENRLGLPQFFGNMIAKNKVLSRIAIPINTHDNIFMIAKKL
jgi:2-polyprenyl-3-methyl-5-hydroxy-6-metoxy-1,4-benzoquinol methylase